ncbi:Hypothetical protein NGAL_HAMBI2605_62590 [Neorhizobium galegae bv. orientalis]|nr:Hypothetical protein NGAL_HAMBI2605_62590 [Neorhizobium galegae bv. orientalis]
MERAGTTFFRRYTHGLKKFSPPELKSPETLLFGSKSSGPNSRCKDVEIVLRMAEADM